MGNAPPGVPLIRFRVAPTNHPFLNFTTMQSTTAAAVDLDTMKQIVTEHIGVPVDLSGFEPDRDLYAAGLTSLATVGLMLAIEERFDVEFPESMLTRATFRNMASIAEAVAKLTR
jgi:acyl carrier protein